MSNPQTTPAATVITDDSNKTPEEVVKHPRLAKARAFVNTHKKQILAIGGLGVLMGASAAAGRASATHDLLLVELEPKDYDVVDGEVIHEPDSVTTD